MYSFKEIKITLTLHFRVYFFWRDSSSKNENYLNDLLTHKPF